MIQIEARTIRELRNNIAWLKGLRMNANDYQLSPTPFFAFFAKLYLHPRESGGSRNDGTISRSPLSRG
jgi:hypothetical protein